MQTFQGLETNITSCNILKGIKQLKAICNGKKVNGITRNDTESNWQCLFLESTRTEVINCYQEIFYLNLTGKWKHTSLLQSVKYNFDNVSQGTVRLNRDCDGGTITELKMKLEDMQYNMKFYLPFTNLYLKTSIEQATLCFVQQEEDTARAIGCAITGCNIEDRVHYEVSTYLNLCFQNLQGQLKVWNERYEIEKREIKIKLQRIVDSRRELAQEHQTLLSLFQDHKNEMEVYIGDKTARQKANEYECYRNNMATKIQSWWRGTMVRRHIGPYKLDKKKKLKDKNKKIK